ncbi:MAG: hypothetical protein KKA22_07005 [Gammaproteobacteria bacterium]|nr:hypothetical protein [Gammaproteobacteria bacterium]MBU1407878.1 hypothetical protein [Gammaproteobacteria bacterium]MBU1531991.1 hypothetical protein [Gammaproteobacteria bacterium]
MRTGCMLLGVLALSTSAWAADERYQALPLAGAEGSQGGGRAFILDTRDGHVWVWSENELLTAPDGSRRYGAGFIYQGKLRPGTRPGELIEPQAR